MTTIGETISRVRNTLKAVKEDAFLTDRIIYSSLLKYAQTLIKREDNQFRLMKISSLFRVLPYIELIDVDKVEAGCLGILNGMFGPIIRTTSSIDGSIEMFRTDPGTWVSMTKTTTWKYNRNFYFWYLDGYIYCPNVDWEAIRMEAIFEGTIETCDTKECTVRQDEPFALPEYLFSEVEQFVIKELTMTMSIPTDGPDDSQNTLR